MYLENRVMGELRKEGPFIRILVKTQRESDGTWLAYWTADCELWPGDSVTGRGETEQEALIRLQLEMSGDDDS